MPKWYSKLDAISRQVYVSFDGADGLIIQTDIATYHSYYKPLGWELLSRATPLPVITEEATPINKQARLL